MKITIEWPMYTVNAKGEDVETIYDVECDLTPSTPDVPYLRNGDPGYPGSPAECEILSIGLQGLGKQPAIDLAPVLWPLLGFQGKVLKEIEERAFEVAADREEGAREDAAEAAEEASREREWEPRNVSQQDDPNDD